MKYAKSIFLLLTVIGSLSMSQVSGAYAVQQMDAAKTETVYTEGEVKRVDLSLGKITIKHSAIQNLGMPPMTMVFTVKEKSMLDEVLPGNQVRFIVISVNGKCSSLNYLSDSLAPSKSLAFFWLK